LGEPYCARLGATSDAISDLLQHLNGIRRRNKWNTLAIEVERGIHRRNAFGSLMVFVAQVVFAWSLLIERYERRRETAQRDVYRLRSRCPVHEFQAHLLGEAVAE